MKLLLLLGGIGSENRELPAMGEYLQKVADTLGPDIIATREWWGPFSPAGDFLETVSKLALPRSALLVVNSKVSPGDYPNDRYVSCISAVSYLDETGERQTAAISKRNCGGTAGGIEKFTVPDFGNGVLGQPYDSLWGWETLAELSPDLKKHGSIPVPPAELGYGFPVVLGGHALQVWHTICSDFRRPPGPSPVIGIESAYSDDEGIGYPCAEVPLWIHCNYGRAMVAIGNNAFLFGRNLWWAEPGAQVQPDCSIVLEGGVENKGSKGVAEFGETGAARSLDKNYSLLVELNEDPFEAKSP
ncbi:MAG: hypothetical protein V1820_05440 [archaeon]